MNNPSMLDKLRLCDNPIRIGDIKLELQGVADIEPLLAELGEKETEGLASFPYWVKIWEAAIVLAAHLYDQDLDKNRSVLELGAGMGVTGLFMAASGHPVTLTDNDDNALALLERNAAKNGLESIAIRKLDVYGSESPGRFDIVCGSELIYRHTHVKPAIRALRECIKPDGTVYLAHNIKRISMVEFLAEAGKYFEIGHAGKSITLDNEKQQFVIHTMTPAVG